jgi:hypothetical protein
MGLITALISSSPSQSLPLDSLHPVSHSFFNSLCHDLVDIHPGDENMYSGFSFFKTSPYTFSKEVKLLAIDLYLGSQLFLLRFRFTYPGFHVSLHFASHLGLRSSRLPTFQPACVPLLVPSSQYGNISIRCNL